MAKQKDLSIETLRGLAIILMVAGHVIGDKPSNGLRVSDTSEFRHLYYSLQFFRLPLFTVISGFVYSLRPVIAGRSLPFLRGKARRILLPMAAVGTLEFLMLLIVPGTNRSVELSQIWRIYVYPFDHFWFLQAIFLVFLTVTALERLKLLETRLRWAIALAIATLLEWNPPPIPPDNLFSFASYLYLLPFFLLGVGLGRFQALMRSPWLIGPAALALAWGLIWQQGAWYGWDLPLLDRVNAKYRGSGFALLIGLTGCTVLFRVRWKTAWLAWLGYYAYGIYLFHVFGTAGSRIVAKKLLGPEPGIALFLVSLSCGLAVPIVIEWVIEHAPERLRERTPPFLSRALDSLPTPLASALRNLPGPRLVFLGLRPKQPTAPEAAAGEAPKKDSAQEQ